MSDVAPAAAPAAPASAPAAAPSDNNSLVVPTNYAEFQARLREQRKAQTSQHQPPKPPTAAPPAPPRLADDPGANDLGIEPNSVKPGGAPPPDAAPEGDLVEDTLDPNAPPPVAAAPEEQAAKDAADLAAHREMMASKTLPFDQFKDFVVELPDGDVETFEEVAKGRMRLKDHTRAYQQWGEKEERYQQHIGAYETHFQQIDDPNTGGDAMYEVYSRRGNRKQMMDMARKLAVEEAEDRDHAEGYKIAVMRRYGIQDPEHHLAKKAFDDALADRESRRIEQDRMRGVEFQNQRLQQQQQQRQQQGLVEETAARINKQLDQLRPRAFAAFGVLDNAKNEAQFREYLAAILKKTGAPKITPELCMEAARCTRDDILDARKAANGGKGGAPQARPGFRPSVGATGGGQIRGNQPEPGLTPEALGKKFGLKSW